MKDGNISESLLVLSLPEVRTAEFVTIAGDIDTADGTVRGRDGDVAVFSYGGERYPIPASIFFGTYEVLATVGTRFVARRLIHVRRAWLMLSDDAQFSYGLHRGEIPVRRDSWVYQSDDEDFGVINPDVKFKSHVEVCPEKSLMTGDWAKLLRRRAIYLAFLPAILSLLALLAFASSVTEGFQWATQSLLLLEALLLLGGVAMVWWIKKERWVLRGAVQDGLRLAKEFQAAVMLLGHHASNEFPGMAIWRAAQNQNSATVSGCEDASSQTLSTTNSINTIKVQLGKTLHEISIAIKRDRTDESRARWITIIAIAIIIFCNSYLIIGSHKLVVELLAIWLPSLIACVHSITNHRYLTAKILAMTEFYAELKFLQSRIFALSQEDKLPTDESSFQEFRTALQALCRTVGVFTQQQLQAALSNSPELPV